MTDLEKYKQRRLYTIRNEELVNSQKLILADLLEKQNNYLSTCTHRFMLELGSTTLLDSEKKILLCLGCNKILTSSKENTSGFTKNIINISEFIDQTNLPSSMINSSDEMILKVREVLDKLAKEENPEQEYSFEIISHSVLNALKEYKETLYQGQSDEMKLSKRKKL